jgi:hypothetical protein
MISILNHVGRLVETRFVAPITDAEIAELGQERARAGLAQEPRIVCIDASHMSVLDPARSARILEALRRPSPGVLRRAFLLPEGGGVVALQVARFIREAQMTDIKAFSDQRLLLAWLDEVLTPPESQRLREFLREIAQARS